MGVQGGPFKGSLKGYTVKAFRAEGYWGSSSFTGFETFGPGALGSEIRNHRPAVIPKSYALDPSPKPSYAPKPQAAAALTLLGAKHKLQHPTP